MYNQPQSAVPPDKIIQQMIVQAIQAFYIQDYDTGLYFLNQIKTNLPRYLYQISPANKTLCKEIVKLLQDGSLVPDRASQTDQEVAATTHPGLSGISSGYDQQSGSSENPEPVQEPIFTQSTEPEAQPQSVAAPEEEAQTEPSFQPIEEDEAPRGTVPTEFISELSSAVATVRDKKKKKVTEKLTGSMDELEDFDF
ncbi:MAG: hypothetical protein KAS47_03770 [Candidatus Heimdallarchaeota archaeon]|nr:hypothetical protein [Candidatus Heimdallarchaeota archaeon]MCK4972906.1 hypothetical protein [Candidatus Heimdallarchaeota archaeon]